MSLHTTYMYIRRRNKMKDEIHIDIETCEIEMDSSEKSCFRRRAVFLTLVALLSMVFVLVNVTRISWFAMIKYFFISKFLKFSIIVITIMFFLIK